MKKILLLSLASILFLFSCEKEDPSCEEIIEKIKNVELAILFEAEHSTEHLSNADKLAIARRKYKDKLQKLDSLLETCEP